MEITSTALTIIIAAVLIGVVALCFSFMRAPGAEQSPTPRRSSMLEICLRVLGVVMLGVFCYFLIEIDGRLSLITAIPYLFYCLASFALAEILKQTK